MLTEQLKDQIAAEAEDNTIGFKDNNDYQAGIVQGYKDGYEIAGERFALKWEQAEARAKRAEKALKDFAHRLKEHCEKMGITSVVLQRITIDMEEFYPHP